MTTGDTAVAVIGVSFELPGARDWAALTRMLRDGVDAVGPYPRARAEAMRLVPGPDDTAGCWQENIGDFDHRRFGMARAEAELIDPRQRRMLTLAVAALGNAGYSPAELRGRDVAVVVAGYCGILPSLIDLLDGAERGTGRAFAGSLPANAAGRIAYHLDLRGPALVVDTACSSFAVALHQARWMLARGESDYALVGGYAAMLGEIPERPRSTEGMGVGSPTGRCRTFDAGADGTVIGEGGGFVLVKRRSDAVRDGDLVHAVLRGSALNQDAGRSNGLTAPSPVAQADVIIAAWRDSGVDPATIGYVEAHGTGTRIGDPIELQGLAQTYGTVPGTAGGRAVSSVKANIGHLDAMAGLAALARVIAQFRTGQIFPTAHFRTLNPLARLNPDTLRITTEVLDWPARGPRRAGISSFGLSGTNAHLIVEEGPVRAVAGDTSCGERVVVLSAADPDRLRRYVARLEEALVSVPASLDRVAAVLAAGREHLPCRYAWVAADLASLRRGLAGTLATDDQQRLPRTPVVLLLGDGPAADLELLAATYPAAARVVAAARGHLAEARWSAAQRSLVRVTAQHAVLTAFGVVPALVLAHGAGLAARRVADGVESLGAALDRVREAAEPPATERVRSALSAAGPELTLVDLAPGGALSAAAAEVAGDLGVVAATSSIATTLAVLYRQGHDLDWREGLGRPVVRIELPSTPMAEEPCWPVLAAPGPAAEEAAPGDTAAPVSDVATEVLRIVGDLLKETVTAENDFFEHGGNSLSGALLVSRLNERFGTDLDVLALYDFPDLAALAAHVGDAVRDPAVAGEDAPLSGQQLAIWTAAALDEDSDAYHVPAAFLLDGDLDPDRLAAGLATLVARHDMLRGHIVGTGDAPRQRVLAAAHPDQVLRRTDLDLRGEVAGPESPGLLRRVAERVAAPFAPDRPPTRFELIRARFRDGDRYVLVLVFHHLFFDGWSWNLVMDQLDGIAPAPPARGYLSYVEAQRATLAGDRGERLRRFWTDYLRGAEPCALPLDHAGALSGMAGTDLHLRVAPDDATRLRALGDSERCSLNMVLTASWVLLLSRLTGSVDLCVAMPVANRPAGDDTVIGCYVNTILVRVRLDGAETFGAVLRRVRDSSLRAISHGDYPIDHILRSALGGKPSPASTMLGLIQADAPRQLRSGLRLEPLDVRQSGAQFPLELTVLDGAALDLVLKTAVHLVDPATAAEWLDDFGALLRRFAREGAAARIDTPAVPTVPDPTRTDLPDFSF